MSVDRRVDTGGETQPESEQRQSAGVRASLLEYLHACPLCASEDLRGYCRVPSLFNAGEFLHYERCVRCGIVLRNPRLPDEYRVHRYVERAFAPAEKELRTAAQTHYWFMMQAITRRLPPVQGRRLLDFGCGAGGFLVEAKAAGFEVMGLELNRDLAEHVRQAYGIPVFQGLITDQSFARERFDVIVTSQVFEHLLDPRATLAQLRSHIRPGGLVLIEVPNLRDVRERLARGRTMDDSHLFYFSRASLGRLLTASGFRVIEVHEGLRPYRFFPRAARAVPSRLLRAAERALSWAQIKTVLGVMAAAQ